MKLQIPFVVLVPLSFSKASVLGNRCHRLLTGMVDRNVAEPIRYNDCSNYMTTTTFINPSVTIAYITSCHQSPTKAGNEQPTSTQDFDVPVVEVTHGTVPNYASSCSDGDYSRACSILGIRSNDIVSYGGAITKTVTEYALCSSSPTPSPDSDTVWPELR